MFNVFNVFKKTRMVIAVGLLAALLAACGGGGGGGKTGDSGSVAESIKSAIAAVPGVADVEARYNVNKGMGSTLSVRIEAEAGTTSLEPVMTDSLRAFSGAVADISGLNSAMGISFQVTELGHENTINPTAVGLPQRPTIPEIAEFAAQN